MSPLFIKSLNRVVRAEEGITARKHASKSPLETANYVRGCCRSQNDNQDRCSLLRIAALAVLPFSIASVVVHAQPPAPLPVEPTVVHGVATIDTAGGHMTVTNSPNAIINWQDFSIGAEQGVHFNQLDATSQVLNRVTGDDPSQILGNLSSNGSVWLINPHGVLFGENARIDVAGLVTSTLDISNIDFMAGKYDFLSGGTNPGQVTNQGHIHTTFGGRVWLIGGQVRNEGLIQTAGGNTVLAAGKSIELIDSGAPNVVVRVSAPENEVVNLGSLVATGGSVDVHGSIVNQGGIIRADSVGADAVGRITLKAGQALTLAESSETQAEGGSVTMAAGTSTYLAGLVDASRQQGTGGGIQLNTGRLDGMAGGSLRADGEQGGHIQVEGRGMVGFSSLLSATGSSQGGSIKVSGDSVYLLNADVDASGGARGGTIHLGGGWQGEGDLPHAQQVFIGTGSEVRANGNLDNASHGGGEIAVWSTESSQHYGLLQARDGGRIELSSRGEIRQTGEIQAGPGGAVLFDPKNLIITDSPPDNLVVENVTGDSYGAVPADGFGFSVALKDDLLAVGAPRHVGGGAVHLFTGAGGGASGLTWTRILASTTNMDEELSNGDQFGTSVALAGDRLAVGAPGDTSDRGAVYLFSGVDTNFNNLSSPSKLGFDHPILEPLLQSGNQFGFAVALDGNRLAVGANGDSTSGPSQGAVYLFRNVNAGFDGLDQPEKVAFDNGLSPLTSQAFFGRSVGLKGDLLAVGAGGDDTGGSDRGAVYLYTGVLSGPLALGKKLSSDSGAGTLTDGGFFGWSVSFDRLGDRLAVGASGDNTGGTQRGAVYLYKNAVADFSNLALEKKFDSNWGKVALQNEDRFGYAVSLSGDQLIVGAVSDQNKPGAAYFITGMSTFGTGIEVSDATFAANPSADSYLTPASITALLNAGTAVALQANNDISINSDVTANNQNGSGGNLTLLAGRNITFGASVTTDNGNLTAVAGDTGANLAFRDDPGAPSTLTIADGVSLSVGTGNATLAAVEGNFVNFSGNTAISTSGGRWLIYTGEPGNANFGGLASGNLALWNYSYPQNPPATITGNRYLFDTAQPQSLTFSTSGGSLTKTYGEDVTSALPNPTVTGANSNTYGGAIIADNSVPLSDLFEGVAAVSSAGAQATANVSGSPYDIIVSAGTLSSSTGYEMAFDSTGTIIVKPAILTYDADPAIRLAGLPVSGLTGDVTGFLPGDSQQADTNGTLVWTTPATTASPAGAYAIIGGGLSAINYNLQQAPGNATALTLINNPANNPPFKQITLDTSVQSINTAIYGSFPVLDAVITCFVIDLAAMRVPRFGRLDLSRMSWDEMQRLIEERREFKEKLFADAIYKLELDPSLANVPLCPSLTDANTGLCRLTDAQRLAQGSKVTQEEPSRIHRKTKVARLPQIERKFVVLFGTDQYVDTNIPPLENAIFDAETVGKLFADKLGYEVKVVKNATKADIVRTLNQLSTEMQPQDSVIIYYAGHGYRNEKTGGGYWIPADASVTDPTTWISNTDVSSMMSDIAARQMVMIADSCYSGTFAEQKLGMAGTGIKPDEVLAKRSVIVMSSGGDEPVADEGKEGHSIFAWDLMQALRDVDNWQPGTTIFEQVKREVMKSFPQTPQYGAVKSAGHEAGGEYLFEFRQLE